MASRAYDVVLRDVRRRAARSRGYRPFDPAFRVLFNSYYNGVGDQHPRPSAACCRARRSTTSSPTARMWTTRCARAATTRATDAALAALIELGLNHEQQHQELILTDILHLLSRNPAAAGALRRRRRAAPIGTPSCAWIALPGGHRAHRSCGRRVRVRQRGAASSRLARALRARIAAGDQRRVPAHSSTTAAIGAPSCGFRSAGTPSTRAAGRRRSTGSATAALARVHARTACAISIRTRRSCTSASSKPTRMRAGPARGCRPNSSGKRRGARSDGDAANVRIASAASPPHGTASAPRRRVGVDVVELRALPRLSPGRPAPSANTTASSCATSTCCAAARARRRAAIRASRIATSSRPTRAGNSSGVRLARDHAA